VTGIHGASESASRTITPLDYSVVGYLSVVVYAGLKNSTTFAISAI
jgi:hypothetical protein